MRITLTFIIITSLLHSSFSDSSGTTPPTGSHGLNLDGKMINLSSGIVSVYSPSFSTSLPCRSTPPDPTHKYAQRPTTTTNPPQTPAPPSKGVSVCLRLLVKAINHQSTIFMLSPSRSPLILESSEPGRYTLRIGRRNTSGSGYLYTNLSFKPHIRCLPNVQPDSWTRLCLTVDTEKNVVQMTIGSNVSCRQKLPKGYVWSGEPVITFGRFDGQVTDVQIWDYPIGYIEIYNFMTGAYGPKPKPFFLTWSSKRRHPKREKAYRECLYFWMKM